MWPKTVQEMIRLPCVDGEEFAAEGARQQAEPVPERGHTRPRLGAVRGTLELSVCVGCNQRCCGRGRLTSKQ